jgi:hypothetical protein
VASQTRKRRYSLNKMEGKRQMAITKNKSGEVSWTHQEGDAYEVTGIDRWGKRFKMTSKSWLFAAGINVWQGSKWLVRDGKRHLLVRVYN